MRFSAGSPDVRLFSRNERMSHKPSPGLRISGADSLSSIGEEEHMDMCDINKKTPGPTDSDRGRTNNIGSRLITGESGERGAICAGMSAQAARFPAR